MNIKKALESEFKAATGLQFNDIEVEPSKIKAIMINEVVPHDPQQDFYGTADAEYLKSTILLFQQAGLAVSGIEEILQTGIYITNAVKTPKSEYTIAKDSIEKSLPALAREIALFPNVKVIMLMGDVAKKAFNMLNKKAARKNVIPSVSTYKLRNHPLYFAGIRVMPSYIMTGGNILIEKSKFQMVGEDIAAMLELIK